MSYLRIVIEIESNRLYSSLCVFLDGMQRVREERVMCDMMPIVLSGHILSVLNDWLLFETQRHPSGQDADLAILHTE